MGDAGTFTQLGKDVCCAAPVVEITQKQRQSHQTDHPRGLNQRATAFISQKSDETIRCLIDAWYMKANFVLPLLRHRVHVIGQVRKDTALYEAPTPDTGSRKRGRKNLCRDF